MDDVEKYERMVISSKFNSVATLAWDAVVAFVAHCPGISVEGLRKSVAPLRTTADQESSSL
jgi:hypothetical protein